MAGGPIADWRRRQYSGSALPDFTVGLGHPAAGMKYRRMLPYLMPWDWIWAASPFLAVHTIGPEWALVLSAVLVYPPISQLILMRSIDHRRNRPANERP